MKIIIKYLHSWQYLTSMCNKNNTKVIDTKYIRKTKKKINVSPSVYQELLSILQQKKKKKSFY